MANQTRPPYWDQPKIDPTGRRKKIVDYANARLGDWWFNMSATAAHEPVMSSDFAYFDDGSDAMPLGWFAHGTAPENVIVNIATAPIGAAGNALNVICSNLNGVAMCAPVEHFKQGEWYNLTFWLRMNQGTANLFVEHFIGLSAFNLTDVRVLNSTDDGDWGQFPGGWRRKPIMFRIEPDAAKGDYVQIRFVGDNTGNPVDFDIADISVQEGRVDTPSISLSKREDYMAHGKSRVLRPIKQSLAEYIPMGIDVNLATYGFPSFGMKDGTQYWAFSAGADEALMWNIKLPMEWTMNHTLKAVKFVYRWTTPTGLTATDTIAIKQLNKMFNGNDNDTIAVSTFGATDTNFYIDGLTTNAFEVHDSVHNMTNNSPAAAGTRKESSFGWIAFARLGADASDDYGDELWLLPHDSMVYWYLEEDHDNFFDVDQDHPLVMDGDPCAFV